MEALSTTLDEKIEQVLRENAALRADRDHRMQLLLSGPKRFYPWNVELRSQGSAWASGKMMLAR